MRLEEHALREWVQRVAHGEASRRHFLRTMLGLGLSGPLIADQDSPFAVQLVQALKANGPKAQSNKFFRPGSLNGSWRRNA